MYDLEAKYEVDFQPFRQSLRTHQSFNFELAAFATKIWRDSKSSPCSPESTRESPGVHKSSGQNESMSLISESVRGPGFIRQAKDDHTRFPKHPNDSFFSHSRERVCSLSEAVVDKNYGGEGQFSIYFQYPFQNTFFLQFQYTFSCFQFLNLVRALPVPILHFCAKSWRHFRHRRATLFTVDPV